MAHMNVAHLLASLVQGFLGFASIFHFTLLDILNTCLTWHLYA